ncbi:hypothetical protein SOASR030_03910 [Leminorella grimontii]|uniref:Uncharacterized protein n=1 Tax=Leminorella grimontii TaxID=82981 RepID=A0AAV5MXZ0_9GAMM|nr:hypothetical protein [Leminorella grimontii]KFC96524.1 hypothetical protein GLGR_1700 [Leminorella grimontii ATCC 33999 = DSM 5078]GKX54279.1 hypothetical protein SOASR030_03910 [Leminorella grimontii]GKX57718.1 hypothetical protein SOASR031_00330 [Leminorella grimontii]VFS59613.1 Uncharacterised protein [Leminorella grimontii]
MGLNEREFVNFSEDYELDYHLRKAEKQKSEVNRMTLRIMGNELKKRLDAQRVTHEQLHGYIVEQPYRLS